MKYIQPNWPAPSHIKAYITLRTGWGGRQPHHELNHGNDTQSHPKYAQESLDLINLLHLPDEPIWITQTHSTTVIEAIPENKEKVADASYTSKPNCVCVVQTADCLPILICNQQGTHVAAIHAGWRGLANGIIESTLQALQQPSHQLLVWLGPAIGPEKFEVGQEVYAAFTAKYPQSAAAFKAHAEGKWLADLYVLAKMRLDSQGVAAIFGGNFCTYTQDHFFFSYRREHKKTGRMASLIWISS
jgi:polyphenol oxidase